MRNLLSKLSSPGVAIFLALVVFRLLLAPVGMASEEDFFEDGWGDEDFSVQASVANGGMVDPLESLNRVFFNFNDRLYFWVLKPVAQGYKAVFADEDVRLCFSNAFHNLSSPIRIVNNLLQGKIIGAGSELASFLINSTLGIAGLADPAHKEFGLLDSDEDFGQTLGSYGVGNGFYICWPFLGPSSLRDTVGTVADSFADPLSYWTASGESGGYALQGGKQVNKISLHIGKYERFKDASFDPYVAVRDAYAQHRHSRVTDEVDAASGYGVSRLERPAEEIPATSVANAQPVPQVVTPPVQKSVELPVPATVSKVSWDAMQPGFFVLVGVYRDPSNIKQQRERVVRVGKGALVARYQRADYSFFGVEVPVGADFAKAKQMEQDLRRAGFAETMVVMH